MSQSKCESCRSVRTHVKCWKCHQGMDGYEEERRSQKKDKVEQFVGRRRNDNGAIITKTAVEGNLTSDHIDHLFKKQVNRHIRELRKDIAP